MILAPFLSPMAALPSVYDWRMPFCLSYFGSSLIPTHLLGTVSSCFAIKWKVHWDSGIPRMSWNPQFSTELHVCFVGTLNSSLFALNSRHVEAILRCILGCSACSALVRLHCHRNRWKLLCILCVCRRHMCPKAWSELEISLFRVPSEMWGCSSRWIGEVNGKFHLISPEGDSLYSSQYLSL